MSIILESRDSLAADKASPYNQFWYRIRVSMKKFYMFVGTGVVLAALAFATVIAATVTQDFRAQEALAKGTVVSLDKEASEVTPASSENIANLYGVVVSSGELSFGPQGGQGVSVSVATSGVVDMLVSTNGGPVNEGDTITVDDLAGIGQKATKAGKVIGVAQRSVDEQTAREVSFTQDGQQKTTKVSLIPVKIEIAEYGRADGAAASNRNKLQQAADNLVGKQVKTYALLIAGLVLLVTVFVSTFLVTSSGYASMISIGRNPLSEKKILRSLVRLLTISVIIFIAGIALAYGVLRIL